MQGEKMNQISFIPSVLETKASEELQKAIAKDLEKKEGQTISELLNEKKETKRS